MLYYALIFLLIAIVAGVMGFGYVEGLAATIAKFLAVLFLLLCALSFARRKGV